jgi:hypothetical protein
VTDLTPVEIPRSFKKKLDKKTPEMQAAILACVRQLHIDWRYPGLRAKKLSGTDFYEARVSKGGSPYLYLGGPKDRAFEPLPSRHPEGVGAGFALFSGVPSEALVLAPRAAPFRQNRLHVLMTHGVRSEPIQRSGSPRSRSTGPGGYGHLVES